MIRSRTEWSAVSHQSSFIVSQATRDAGGACGLSREHYKDAICTAASATGHVSLERVAMSWLETPRRGGLRRETTRQRCAPGLLQRTDMRERCVPFVTPHTPDRLGEGFAAGGPSQKARSDSHPRKAYPSPLAASR